MQRASGIYPRRPTQDRYPGSGVSPQLCGAGMHACGPSSRRLPETASVLRPGPQRAASHRFPASLGVRMLGVTVRHVGSDSRPRAGGRRLRGRRRVRSRTRSAPRAGALRHRRTRFGTVQPARARVPRVRGDVGDRGTRPRSRARSARSRGNAARNDASVCRQCSGRLYARCSALWISTQGSWAAYTAGSSPRKSMSARCWPSTMWCRSHSA